jgi:O-antigen/teichoic acid export membrane protein
MLNKGIVFDVFWVFSGRLGKTLFMFVLNILVAREFGLTSYSDFIIVMSFYIPAGFCTLLGYSYFFNVYDRVIDKNFFWNFMFICGLSLLLNSILLCFIDLGSFFIMLLMFFGASIVILISEVLRGVGRLKESILVSALIPSSITFFLYYIFANKIDDIYWCFLLGSLCSVFVGFLFIKELLIARSFSWSNLRKDFCKAIPLLSLNLSMLLAPQTIIWFSSFLNNDAAGILGVCSRIIFLFSLPIWLVNGVLPRRLSSNKGSILKIKSIYKKCQLFVFLGALFLYLIFYIFGEWLIQVTFGAEYKLAYQYSLILGLGVLAQSLLGPSSLVLNVLGRVRSILFSQLIVFVFLIIMLSFSLYLSRIDLIPIFYSVYLVVLYVCQYFIYSKMVQR